MKSPEDELKRLLLAAELDLLERLRERCDHLEARVGDDPAMRESLRGVILDVLRDAGVRDHDRLARVLAPLMLSSMREEIRNSSDMMVDALYPITGRLVAAAVRNAFRELMATLNEKLDDSFSLERWKIRLQAKATGRSEAELLLQRHPPFEIEDLLLIQRQTGLLIARAGDEREDEGEDAGARVDSDLIGGMLTAIMSFTRDALGNDGTSELRTLSFGDADLFLRTSPAVILAVKARGTPPAGFEGALEALFGAFLEQWGDLLRDYDGAAAEDETHNLVADLRDRFGALEAEREQNFRGRSYKGYAALAAAVFLIVAWFGYASYQSWRVADIEATARQVVAADPALAGYPIELRYDETAQVLRVEGLLPDSRAMAGLEGALGTALPGIDSTFRMAALPRSEIDQLANISEQLAGRLDLLEEAATRLESSLAGVVSSLDGETTVLNQRTGDLEGLAGDLERTVDALSTSLADRLARLEKQTGSLEKRAGSFENSFEALSGSLDTQLSHVEQKTKDLEGLAGGLEISIDSVSQGLGNQLEKQSGDLQSLAGRIESSVDNWSQSLSAQLDRLDQRLAALEQTGPTPLDSLQAWTKRNAIFFAHANTLSSPEKAEAKLRELAALLLAGPAETRMRIVGYADATGSNAKNREVSVGRARKIVTQLQALKIPAARLHAVGRSSERPINDSRGKNSENRRVEFELIFPGES